MTDVRYESLRGVLDRAFAHATQLKGEERHGSLAGGRIPFTDQQMLRNARVFGVGGPLAQVAKKAEEAKLLHEGGATAKAVDELLGAINYACGAILEMERQAAVRAGASRSSNPAVEPPCPTCGSYLCRCGGETPARHMTASEARRKQGKCGAVQCSDQMVCACGNAWDMNDPNPPACKDKR